MDTAETKLPSMVTAGLKLNLLKRPGAMALLEGFKVLDACCRGGEICSAMLAAGAASVVGLCNSRQVTSAAKLKCPAGVFIEGSWKDVPDEAYDLIVMSDDDAEGLPNRAVFKQLAQHLTPRGTLVIKCKAVRDGLRSRSWRIVNSNKQSRRYPTIQYLTDHILDAFDVRQISKEPVAAGAVVQQVVFHCVRRLRAAVLLIGKGNIGKTNIARLLQSKNIPVYAVDELLSRLTRLTDYKVSSDFDQLLAQNYGPSQLNLASQFVKDNGLAEKLADIIVNECPMEVPLFVIEGEALIHENIQTAVRKMMTKRGVRVLIMTKLPKAG